MGTRKRGVLLVILAIVAAAALVGVFAWRAHLTSSADKQICRETEAIKALIRDEANEDWRNLDRNLRLLKIAKTPEIERTARESRDRKLRRFRPRDCDHLPSNGGTS